MLRLVSLFLSLILLAVFASSADPRPRPSEQKLNRSPNQAKDIVSLSTFGEIPELDGRRPIPFFNPPNISTARYFGGTIWAADSSRWEALPEGTWTFDSGVGSHFNHAAPFVQHKDSTLHASMEGWIGFTPGADFEDYGLFRRLSESDFAGGDVCVGDINGLGGDYSLWAGVLQAEAVDFGFVSGQGYANEIGGGFQQSFTYSGSGAVTLEYDYTMELEPGFDYLYVEVDTSGAGDFARAHSVSGVNAGHETLVLTPGTDLRSDAGPIEVRFQMNSDGSYSDEDGYFGTLCGAFALDNIQLSGGINTSLMTFETGDEGWGKITTPINSNGFDWSDIRDLTTLPPFETSGPCALEDSVLAFEDLTVGGHRSHTTKYAVSPWIDLKRSGSVGTDSQFIEFDLYSEPIQGYGGFAVGAGPSGSCGPQNSVFVQVALQWSPCPRDSGFTTSGLEHVMHIGIGLSQPFCTEPGSPLRIEVTDHMYQGAEQVRVVLGAYRNCFPFGNCGGCNHPSPYFDNVRFGVLGGPSPVPTRESPPAADLTWGTEGTGPGEFNRPYDIDVDSNGFVYVGEKHRVQKFNADGQFLFAFGDSGSGPGQFLAAIGISVADNGEIYVCDSSVERIQKFDSGGNFLLEWGSPGSGPGQFDGVLDLVIAADGFIYAADSGNNRIQIFNQQGIYIGEWEAGYVSGVTPLPNGNLVVVRNREVAIYKPTGDLVKFFGSPLHCALAPGVQHFQPKAPGVDGQGNIYVGDFSLQRIQKVTPDGMLLSVIGDRGEGLGQFNQVTGVSLSPDGTALYAADFWLNRVTRFSYPNGGPALDTPWLEPQMLSPYPNPGRGLLSIPIRGSGLVGARVRVDIFSISGRRIRTLHAVPSEQEQLVIQWNGLGDSGQEVAPGVYFVRVRSEQRLLGVAKVVRLK